MLFPKGLRQVLFPGLNGLGLFEAERGTVGDGSGTGSFPGLNGLGLFEASKLRKGPPKGHPITGAKRPGPV
ncbi:MAG: hypothetical protein F4113_11520 [Rhodothermaceae bacterium]|nr:hypothetical protein [Rhodothermaceae bacterium]